MRQDGDKGAWPARAVSTGREHNRLRWAWAGVANVISDSFADDQLVSEGAISAQDISCQNLPDENASSFLVH